MKTALLIFNGKSRVIEVTDAIYNLYNLREEMCEKSIDYFMNKINSLPKNSLIIDHPEVFQESENDYEDDELDEIIDGYFYKKGEELFGFNIEDVFVEYYVLGVKEDIYVGFTSM